MFDRYIDLMDSYPDTSIITGKGVFSQFVIEMEHCRVNRMLAFTGALSVEASGAWKRFMSTYRRNSVDILKYSDIEPEPCVETVDRMVATLRDYQPDEVVAIGGGSVMDAAKAAWLVYQAGGKVPDYFGVNKFSTVNPGRKLKRVKCFPTTSGTGSEVTQYSNIVDTAAGVKRLIAEDEIIPTDAMLVPALTFSCPRELTLSTGLDALTHAIEGYLNVGRDDGHPVANKWAETAIAMIVENLPRAMKAPDDAVARAMMSYAACFGGMVIRYKSTGLPHLCSFSWMGVMPHGLAAAMLLPYAWDYYIEEEKVAERTMKLAPVFGVGDGDPLSVVKAYREFILSLGVPAALKDVGGGMNKSLLKRTAASASANTMKLELSPRPVPVDEAEKVLAAILEKAWKGDLRA